MNRQERRRKGTAWEVINVKVNADGGRTLTMRNRRGNIKTENYPAGAMVQVIVCGRCRERIAATATHCKACGAEIDRTDQ